MANRTETSINNDLARALVSGISNGAGDDVVPDHRA